MWRACAPLGLRRITSLLARQTRHLSLLPRPLVVHLAPKGQPAIADLDVDELVRDLGIRVKDLKCDPADVGVGTTLVVKDPDLQLVVEILDARDAAGIADRRATLAEAADRAAQHDRAVGGRDRDLVGRGDPGVTDERSSMWSSTVAL